ncbi:MAG: PilZ domain-containing protein [Lysobacter sp.]
MSASPADTRRKPRRRVPDTVSVVDSMTGQVVGRLGNISETGMLLIASTPLVDDGLYQLRFELADHGGRPLAVEIGGHVLWHDDASAPGQSWCGLRFINLPEAQRRALRDWLELPGGSYV